MIKNTQNQTNIDEDATALRRETVFSNNVLKRSINIY